MRYLVILNEQTSIYLSNISYVEREEDTIYFKGLDKTILGAFKMYQIVGFYRTDMAPEPAPKYEWDFDLLEKHTKKQNEEADKENTTIYGTPYKELVRVAENVYKSREYSFAQLKDSMNEVVIETHNRGKVIPTGGIVPLLVRNKLKEFLESETDHFYINRLNHLLKINMDHCIGESK